MFVFIARLIGDPESRRHFAYAGFCSTTREVVRAPSFGIELKGWSVVNMPTCGIATQLTDHAHTKNDDAQITNDERTLNA